MTQELIERKLLQSFTFGPKISLENPGQILSYKESVENVTKKNQTKKNVKKSEKNRKSKKIAKYLKKNHFY